MSHWPWSLSRPLWFYYISFKICKYPDYLAEYY